MQKVLNLEKQAQNK